MPKHGSTLSSLARAVGGRLLAGMPVAALTVAAVASTVVPSAGALAASEEQATRSTAAVDAPATSRFVPLPPTRVLDARTGLGAARGVLPPRGTVELQVTGVAGIPTNGVTAVVLNVTLTGATGPGFVQVFPTGRGTPGDSSNLNVQRAGQTVPVAVPAPVGEGGKVSLYTYGGGHLLADVSGYFVTSGDSAAGRYRPLTPQRLLDTRIGLGRSSGQKTPIGRGQALTLQVTGRGGVPASGVTAVALNVTATAAAAPGFLQVLPSAGSTAAGASSNLNLVTGQTVANLVIVPVGDSGAVDFYSSSGTHALADVAGWFTDDTTAISGNGLYVPVAPTRLIDTREGSKPGDGASVQVEPLGSAGIPADGVSSVVLNLTATLPVAGGFVQALPTGQGEPGAFSNLNLERPGQTVANAALATLGDGGAVTLYTLRSTHLLADVAGWFTSAATAAGELPEELRGLRVAPRSDAPYVASAWPHWLDDDGDCIAADDITLANTSMFEATWSEDGCRVTQGLWRDPFTGDKLSYREQLEVVHLVPLPEANASGGASWDADRRAAYANDLADMFHLQVVGRRVAADRADRGPQQWQPPLASGRCDYARSWAGVKDRWELTVTQAELDALRGMLATC